MLLQLGFRAGARPAPRGGRRPFAWAAAWAGLALGCAADPADDPKGAPVPTVDSGVELVDPVVCEDSEGLTWDGFGWGFFLTYCNACHSASTSDRYGAPEGVDFDSAEDVARQSGRVRARVIDAGTMPLGGGVPADALAQLDAYLCLIDSGG